MTNRLNVSDVVNVTVDLSPKAATYRNFGAAIIMGDSNVIDVGERIRVYSDIDGIVQDFGVNAPEYKAALLHFSQSPKPNILYIGRWAAAASNAELKGRELTTAQQLMSVFTPITAGSFMIYLNGTPRYISGLNFTTAQNLNNVASLIETAVEAEVASSTVVWNSVYKRFELKSGTLGADGGVTYAEPPTAFGKFTFGGNPAPADKVTINSKDITFVSESPSGNEVLIGNDQAATQEALELFINTQTADADIAKVKALVDGNDVYIISILTGTAGNAYTINETSTVITKSGANLVGGTGTDISDTLGWRVAGGSRLVAGMAAETLPAGVAALMDYSGDWYAMTVAAAAQITNQNYIDAAQLIEAASTSRLFGVTLQTSDILDPVTTLDLASALQTLNLKRTFMQYCTSNPYAATAMFARAATVDFNANNSTITLKFKQEPGIAAEFLTETQAATLKRKNVSVFAAYQNLTAILQEGTMANGFFFDEVHGTDWLQNRLQEDVWNLFLTSPTKIPQTDQGMHMIVTCLTAGMVAAVNNGLVAGGRWTGPNIGQLHYGNMMDIGFYIYAPPIADQAQADREARKAPPIQIAAKMAGAIHFASVIVYCNR